MRTQRFLCLIPILFLLAMLPLYLIACTSEATTIKITETVTETATASEGTTNDKVTNTVTETLPTTITVTVLGTQTSVPVKTETVTVTQTQLQTTTTKTVPPTTTSFGYSRDNAVPMMQTFLTPDGIELTVMAMIGGIEAWGVIHTANQFNEEPSQGMQYVIITIKAKNISSEKEPYSLLWDLSLSLIGSSNIVFNTFDKPVVLLDEGHLSDLDAELYHNGEYTGSIAFYIPENETDLILIEDFFLEDYKLFFEVNPTS